MREGTKSLVDDIATVEDAEQAEDSVREVNISAEQDQAQDEAELVEALASGSKQHRKIDATQMYLSEIGFSPLLSAEEEV